MAVTVNRRVNGCAVNVFCARCVLLCTTTILLCPHVPAICANVGLLGAVLALTVYLNIAHVKLGVPIIGGLFRWDRTRDGCPPT